MEIPAAKRLKKDESKSYKMTFRMATSSHVNVPLFDQPAYTPAVAARYVRVPYQTLRYWLLGRHQIRPVIEPADKSPLILSFANLVECHVLNALRTRYSLHLPKVRSALDTLKRMTHDKHPLLSSKFSTDGVNLFVDRGALVNVSQGGQAVLRQILEIYLERIEWHENIPAKLFPFVAEKTPDEPRIISISPEVQFGRSVLDGTGISTAVIASRFWAREEPTALAKEYERDESHILEAIRWEGDYLQAA